MPLAAVSTLADIAAARPPTAEVAPAPVHPDRRNAVQADLGLAVIGLAYERMFAPRIALQIEAQIFGTWFGPTFDLPDMTGFGGQLRPTFFLTEDGPRGVYLAPFLRVDRVTAELGNRSNEGIGYSTGAFLGYSFVFADRLNLRIGAGGQFMSYVVDIDRQRVSFKTFFPGIDLVVGFMF